MLSLIAVLLTAQPDPSLVLPGLNAVNLAPGEGDLYSELLAQELTRQGFKLQTARDVSAVLGLERQKQLLGCAESSCLAELASAIGADGLVLGDVGKLGQGYVVNVKVLLAKDASAVALFSEQCGEGEVAGCSSVARGRWRCSWRRCGPASSRRRCRRRRPRSGRGSIGAGRWPPAWWASPAW